MNLFEDFKKVEGTNIVYPIIDNTATKNIIEKKILNWDNAFNNIEEIKQLKENDIVIDIGAWIGDTTETFLKKKCIVHSFEPRPDTFVCLLNNCPNANCYNIALGNGKSYNTEKRGGNTGAYPLIDGNKKTIKLDSIWNGKLDFLKIDVEGYEAEVLKGASNTIIKNHPILHLEINPTALSLFDEDENSIIDLLKQMSYNNFREVYRYGNKHWDIIAK